MPVVTLVDTPGAYPGLGAEERGQSVAIAETIMRMSRLPVPIVAVVTGEGGSGGALALGGGRPGAHARERVLLGDQPGGLRDDPVQGRAAAAPRAAAALRMTAPRPAAARGDGRGGARARRGRAHRPARAGANLKAALVESLGELLALAATTSWPAATSASASSARPAATGPAGRGEAMSARRSTCPRELLEAVWNEARDADVSRAAPCSSCCRCRWRREIEIERASRRSAPRQRLARPRARGPVALGGPGPRPGCARGRGRLGLHCSAPERGRRPHPRTRPAGRHLLPRSAARRRRRSSRPGDVVEGGSAVCIVEAMKMMNEVVAADGGSRRRVPRRQRRPGRVRAGPHVPRARSTALGEAARCSRRS